MTVRPNRIHELVSAAAATVPDRPAIIAEDGTVTTFAQFDRAIGAVAGWVAAHTRLGDRIAVIADNSPNYALLYYAVPRAGRILVLINQRLSTDEQRAQLATVTPAMVLGDRRFLDALGRPGAIGFDDQQWVDAQHDHPVADQPDPDSPAWLLFTSGSTGTPKGVVHSHRSIATAVHGTIAGRSVRPGGVYLLPFPMCHIAGYNMLVHHGAQSTVLPVATYRPESFAAAVNAHQVTSCSLAPTMLHSLLAHLDATGIELPTLRDIAYGSSAIPADLLRRALDRLDVGFHQGYGMTETGGNITFLGPEEHRLGAAGDSAALATAGRPHSEVQIRIASDGEILVRGAQVAVAYWPNTPATEDGWLHTGDVGRIDDGGRLIVSDRLKDIIITGGENVSSREVEDVLSSHRDVDQVAVVGVPDDYWGEAICAVVVPRPGAHPEADSLISHVRNHIAAFKRPRHVLFVEALPLTTNGKIAKQALREQLQTHFS
ncbi:AMP-binding protein [Mycobacterium sp. OTB74]|jgi:acyl-CoA synthetase (AMP-forming)/AMP-acid ligase II|uniref:AMP-binding protein n=1 Tax=Mycobacterium sp. OTB74 TaxID=1853452 RepID=UPI0024762846|nr:AMP-binding protein [Mycobacterium sp. OTB74]MDH6242751.1 acyl-CoA synthetase (AMP-forming)/AMP-acid ligase II [Mycobacterium sp. OTB74]